MARDVIAKIALRRSEVIKATCLSGGLIKIWMVLPPEGYFECVLNVRALWLFAKWLYIYMWRGCMVNPPLLHLFFFNTSFGSLIWRYFHLFILALIVLKSGLYLDFVE